MHFSAALVEAAAQAEAEPHQRHEDDKEQSQENTEKNPDLVLDDLQVKQKNQHVPEPRTRGRAPPGTQFIFLNLFDTLSTYSHFEAPLETEAAEI